MFASPAEGLKAFTESLAEAFARADSKRPQKVSRTGNVYQHGIGPFTEDETVDLALSEMPKIWNGCSFDRFISFPNAKRNKCDLSISSREWRLFIEIKMMRILGDNGKINDNIISHILSPYSQQRSAYTDIEKLRVSGFDGKKSIMIYGYDYDEYPLDLIVDMFESVAAEYISSPRYTAYFRNLVHPVHQRGAVYSWLLAD